MYLPQYNIVEDYNYYLQNKVNFYNNYPGKYIIIRYKKVIGVFDNYMDAQIYGINHFRIFEYYIQYCFLPKNMSPGVVIPSKTPDQPSSLNFQIMAGLIEEMVRNLNVNSLTRQELADSILYLDYLIATETETHKVVAYCRTKLNVLRKLVELDKNTYLNQ